MTVHGDLERNDETVAIPVLDVLGDRLEYAAARSIDERRNRAARPWGLTLAPLGALLAVVLVAGLQLAPAADASERVIRAADRTAAHPTGRFRMTTRAESSAAVPMDLAVTGEYDRRTNRLRSTVDLSRLIGGAGLPGANQNVEVIQDGSTLYLKSDLIAQLLPNRVGWAKLDMAKLAAADHGSGAVAGAITSGGLSEVPADPADLLDALRGMGSDTTVIGSADIKGAATTHYRGRVQLGKAERSVTPAEARRLRDGFARLGIGVDDAPFVIDVWIDERGDVRRVQAVLDLSKAKGADGSSLGTGPTTVTTDYLDLGVPPTISVPEAGDVADITMTVAKALKGPLDAVPGGPPGSLPPTTMARPTR